MVSTKTSRWAGDGAKSPLTAAVRAEPSDYPQPASVAGHRGLSCSGETNIDRSPSIYGPGTFIRATDGASLEDWHNSPSPTINLLLQHFSPDTIGVIGRRPKKKTGDNIWLFPMCMTQRSFMCNSIAVKLKYCAVLL